MIGRLYLVRHAHAEWEPDEDRPLSARGRDDAARVADRLAASGLAAIYSSPARRAVETVEALADRAGIRPVLLRDLREREAPPQPTGGFDDFVRRSWLEPAATVAGAEPMIEAQARGLRAIRFVLSQHLGRNVAVATHGNLLALIVNALDSSRGYDLWRSLTFPDVYELRFDGDRLEGMRRLWGETTLTRAGA